MDSKSQLKAVKRKVIDLIIKLGEDELILKQTAITNIGLLLKECKTKPLENVKQILVEVLMSIIVYSSVDSKIKNLDNFVSDIPQILNIPNIIRFQSMKVLLDSCCYDELEIIRRLSSINVCGTQAENSEYSIPAIVIRPLLERIVNKHNNDSQIINETINFLFHNKQCINNMIDICFDIKEYDLLHKFLLIILPIVDLNTLTNIFNYINLKIITLNLHNFSKNKNELNFKVINILYLMMANTRCEFSIINILINTISIIDIEKETSFTILSLIIISSLIENSSEEEVSNNLGDPIQMIRLLKLTLEYGGIKRISDRELESIRDLMFITLTILLYKSKDISEFEILMEVIELFLKNFSNINVLTLISALVYHVKGNLVQNDCFCSFSKKILNEKFKFNGIEELKSIEFNYSPFNNFSRENIYDEINTLFFENSQQLIQKELANNFENIKIELVSKIYNGLYLAFNYHKIHYFLENKLLNNYIYDDVYCLSIISVLLEMVIKHIENGDPKYCKEIVEFTRTLLILNSQYQVKIFDSLFPIYEFILNQFKQIDAITDSIYYSMISFGNNKNMVPIIYNKIISAEGQPKTKVLEKIYHLFLKGELPYSKLESLLIDQIDSELSNTSFGFDKFQNGIKILFCVIRYKPDIVDEVIIGKIQKGLNSKNRIVVSYSLHCLIELCKFGIIDYDKCIRILLAIHSNILIVDFNLPDNITQLKVIENQNFGVNNCVYPIEIISSFLRFFGLYIDHKWPSEDESYQKKIPNNLFYILSMLTKIIKDKTGLESVYCLNIFSKIMLDFFYQHVNMDITLKSFLSWCIELGFSNEIGNFFNLLDILQQFIIIIQNYDGIDFNTLHFFVYNISSPLKAILNFELINEIFSSKKNTNDQQFGMYMINIKYNAIDYLDMKDTFLENLEGNSNNNDSSELILNKLKSIKVKTTHNYYIQEILGLFLFDSKQVRIEVMKNIDKINIDQFRITILKDLFKFFRNIKLICCTTFQWQMVFQFIKILKEYFNQLEFIFFELIPRSKNNNNTGNVEQETLFLFFLLLSYLPSTSNLNLIFNDYSDLIRKCKLIRESEKQLFDELFIDNQAILILFLSSLVILRYDILDQLYKSYISEIANFEILPNKLFIAFVNSNIIINKYFSNKNCLLKYFATKKSFNLEKSIIILAFQKRYYVNKEINAIDFISCLLKHLHQHSLNHLDTLNNYFKVVNNHHNFKIYTCIGAENQLLDEICITSNVNLINSYAFGVFSFFDMAFDTFSEKDELLDHVLYLYNLSASNDPKNIMNLIFRTASALKLFQYKIITVYEIFDYINRYFILYGNNNNYNNGVTQEINFQLGLIRAFCFSFINYYLKKIVSTSDKPFLKNEQTLMIEEYAIVNMNIVKYLISTIFYENSTNDNQAFIISCIKLLKGYYWVPWISFLYNKSVNNFDILNDVCGTIYKNQLSSIKAENKNFKGYDKYSNIDLLLQSCTNDPIKMSICILLLSLQTINLSNSLENKLNFHNKERYFDIKILNKNSLFFVTILKFDSYTFRLKNQIEDRCLNNIRVNLKDINILQDLVMIGVIIELFESIHICEKFTNFDISNSLEVILFQVIIPLCDLILLKGGQDDENQLILEWFVILITKFLISYLNSNNSFSRKVIEFGYLLLKIFKNLKFNDLIMLSFTRIVGVVIFTSDSNFSFLYEFIINVFDTLENLENYEMQITTFFVNLNSVFNSAIISKKPLIYVKIEVLINSLGEISYKLYKFYNKPILNSFKLLINTIYDFLNSNNQKSIISNLSKNINPLLLDRLILENKLSINIIHEFYLNLEIKEINYEIISLVNFYYLYSLKDKSAETEILNFLYKDFVESGNASLKRIVVIINLFSFMLIPDSTSFPFNYCSNKDSKYYDVANSEDNIVNNWIDLRFLYLLDLEDNPKLKAWNGLFINNDGIIFLSRFYYLVKRQLFSSIDTNLFYDKDIISFSLYEFPKIFLFELDSNLSFDTWRKSIPSLFSYSKYKTVSVDQRPYLQYNYRLFLETSHKILFKLNKENLKTSFTQFKDLFKIIIKKLIETNDNKKLNNEINLARLY
ncbi:uncharacterized protein ELE39_002541 [Cryptosporidium sp. chipmunk genotype I]|uniref:uncharacterized protein n=1 Tax=Cryptosporidium sp. chipmunk genotype I TaxID=1280935 RepID=UPI00351A70FA|nr:hypothetical protein ELE39_002541 [Cryptosporidium sp. chipmunk genotype I]